MFETAERYSPRPTNSKPSTSPETTAPERTKYVDYNRLLKRHEREQKHGHSRLRKLGTTATILAMLGTGAHITDTTLNRIEAAESKPAIKTLSQEYMIDDNSTTFYLAGFDTRNGDAFGKGVGVAIHQIIPGIDASVDYGNAPLEPVEIAETIINRVESSNKEISPITIAGNSLGGLVSAEVAKYIVHNTDIPVSMVVFNATPNGSGGLRPETQGELASLIDTFNNLKFLSPKYSTAARYIVTLAQENGRYINDDGSVDPTALWETSGKTWERIHENRVPGMWLTMDQASAVTDINLEEATRTIGEQRDTKRMPVYLVFRTTNPDDDKVILSEQSSNDICTYAENAGLVCHIIKVDGAIHTSYQFDSEAYVEAIAPHIDTIKADLAKEATEFALARQSIWLESNFTADGY